MKILLRLKYMKNSIFFYILVQGHQTFKDFKVDYLFSTGNKMIKKLKAKHIGLQNLKVHCIAFVSL